MVNMPEQVSSRTAPFSAVEPVRESFNRIQQCSKLSFDLGFIIDIALGRTVFIANRVTRRFVVAGS